MKNLHEGKMLLESVINIARQAAQKIMEVYGGIINIEFKDDSSPITEADTIAHDLILKQLAELTPTIPVVSEEGEILKINDADFWLVDPLDGTKEFIQRNGEFTVNIAYIRDFQPKIGVVCAPALELTYAGIIGDSAFKIFKDDKIVPIRVQTDIKANEEVILVGSRNHCNSIYMENFLLKFSNNRLLTVGSSLKFCKIAEGVAHIYPRFGRTMEWDTAAGQAVLMAAGGFVYTLDGEPLSYAKAGFENPYFISCASHNFLDKGTQKWLIGPTL